MDLLLELLLDLKLDLFEAPATLISAQGGSQLTNTIDWAWAQFSFPHNRKAFISISRTAAQMVRSVKVVENQNIFQANFQSGDIEVGKVGSDANMIFSTQNIGKSDNLLLETENFILSLQGQQQLKVSGQQGATALQLAEQVLHMIESK